MADLKWQRGSRGTKCVLVAGIVALICFAILYVQDVNILQNMSDHHAKSNRPPRPRPHQGKRPESDERHANIEQVQSISKNVLKEYCQKNSSSGMLFRVGNFFVSDKYKVLYCKIGKTGSTTTSTLVYNLEFATNFSQQEYWLHQATTPIKRLSTYTKDEQRIRLNTYKKLLVVRNPLERLASAYLFFFGGKDNYVGNGRQVSYTKKYQEMLETIARNSSTMEAPYTEDLGVIQTRNETYHVIPFLAFIRAVTGNRDWKNEHWALISSMCPPCQVDFDFIAHTETLANDLKTFFKNAGVSGRDDVFPSVRARMGNTKIWDLYRQIPIKEIQRIYQKFKPDFDLFGYSVEDTILHLLST